MTIFVNNVGSIVRKPWKGNLRPKGSSKQPYYYWNDLNEDKILQDVEDILKTHGYTIDFNE